MTRLRQRTAISICSLYFRTFGWRTQWSPQFRDAILFFLNVRFRNREEGSIVFFLPRRDSLVTSESKHGSGLAEAVSRLIPVLVLVAPVTELASCSSFLYWISLRRSITRIATAPASLLGQTKMMSRQSLADEDDFALFSTRPLAEHLAMKQVCFHRHQLYRLAYTVDAT